MNTMDNDTKILAVGDLHGALGYVERDVIPHALDNDCRLLMQVGDFGFVWDNDIDEVTRKLTRLSDMLDEAGLPLHFLPGNHENWWMLKWLADRCEQRSAESHYRLAPRVYYTGRASSWQWEGLRIAAVGGAVSIDRAFRTEGESWWQEETLTPQEAEAAKSIGRVDLLFSHDAPLGVPMRLAPDLASTAHRAQMTDIANALEPAMWIHGHYHESLHYRWQHGAGNCVVRGLACNGASRRDATTVVNLTALSRNLAAVHYGTRDTA